jgi:hypothetical protein
MVAITLRNRSAPGCPHLRNGLHAMALFDTSQEDQHRSNVEILEATDHVQASDFFLHSSYFRIL